MPKHPTAFARSRTQSVRKDPDDMARWEARARVADDADWGEACDGVSHQAIQDAAKAFFVAELAIRQLALVMDDLADTVYCDLPFTRTPYEANVHPRSFYAHVNAMKALADGLEDLSQPVEGPDRALEDDAFSWLAEVHGRLSELARLNGTPLALARMDARTAFEQVAQQVGQTVPEAL